MPDFNFSEQSWLHFAWNHPAIPELGAMARHPNITNISGFACYTFLLRFRLGGRRLGKEMYAWIFQQSAVLGRKKCREQMTDSWGLVENVVGFKHCLSVVGVLTVNTFHTRCSLNCAGLRISLHTVAASSGSLRILGFQKGCSSCSCPAQGVPAKRAQGLGRLLTPKKSQASNSP